MEIYFLTALLHTFLLHYFLTVLLHKTKLIFEFPCLLNLSPTNLEWPASFFNLSLPSVYKASLQTNIILFFSDYEWNCDKSSFKQVLDKYVFISLG